MPWLMHQVIMHSNCKDLGMPSLITTVTLFASKIAMMQFAATMCTKGKDLQHWLAFLINKSSFRNLNMAFQTFTLKVIKLIAWWSLGLYTSGVWPTFMEKQCYDPYHSSLYFIDTTYHKFTLLLVLTLHTLIIYSDKIAILIYSTSTYNPTLSLVHISHFSILTVHF